MNKKLVFIISGILVVAAVCLIIYIYLSSLHPYENKPLEKGQTKTEPAGIQPLPLTATSLTPDEHKTQAIESGVSADQLISKIKSWKKEFPDLFRQNPDLEETLKKSNGQVTSQIIKSLLSYANPEGRRDAQSPPRVSGTPVEPNKKEQIAKAIGLLSDSNPEKRISALQTLTDLQAKEAIPEIIRLSYDPDASVRAGTLYALGKLGAKEAIQETIRCLYDPDAKVRIQVIATLKALKGKEATPEIMRLLPDPDAEVRSSAIRILRELDAKEAIPDITKLLYDSDIMVRQEAIYTLGELQAKESIPDIRNLLSDSNEKIRKAAEEALHKLESK